MKIRNGFVSNSSSSSFVVAFPPDFDATELIKKAIRENGGDYIDTEGEEEELLNQDHLDWFDNDIWECIEYGKFSVAREILNDSNTITSFTVTSDNGQIINLFSKKNIDNFKKVLKNPVVRDYLKELIKKSESNEN